MSQYLTDGYYGETAAAAPKSERVAFIQRTYLHLCGAVLAFVGLEALLLRSGIGDQFLATMAASKIAWIGLLVLFIAAACLPNTWLARTLRRLPSTLDWLFTSALRLSSSCRF